MSVMSEPMPMIMAAPFDGAAFHARRASPAPRSASPPKTRLADQEVADVELDDLRQRRDGLGGAQVEPWPAWTSSPSDLRAVAPCRMRELAAAIGSCPVVDGLAPRAGVDLDHRRADLRRLRSAVRSRA
jgi:hypothetical protein